MKTPTIAIVLCSLLTAPLMAVEPSIVALPSPPATVGTFAGTAPLCALTSKWLVASGAFTDPVTQTVKRACFVYDTATLRFIRRIALTGLTSSLAAEGDVERSSGASLAAQDVEGLAGAVLAAQDV